LNISLCNNLRTLGQGREEEHQKGQEQNKFKSHPPIRHLLVLVQITLAAAAAAAVVVVALAAVTRTVVIPLLPPTPLTAILVVYYPLATQVPQNPKGNAKKF
jgi:hypothetical protein